MNTVLWLKTFETVHIVLCFPDAGLEHNMEYYLGAKLMATDV